MKQILFVEVSPRKTSASRKVTEKLSARLRAEFPNAKLVYRDLAKDKLPHLDDSTLKAISSKDSAEVEANKDSGRLSDQLIGELLASDLLVIATPMWNFGIPSALKAWIDLIVRAGKTFQYSEAGVAGLAKGRRAVLVIASGGVFSDGPWKPFDFVEPYLRHILNFIGIENVQTIRVEGSNIPPLAEAAIPNANAALERLVF
jgi:FMN-dependent NADH-azoreductase